MQPDKIRKLADKIAFKKKKITKKDIKSIAEHFAEGFDDEVNEAMATYGEEAVWKLDKFLPDSNDIREDIKESYFEENFEFENEDVKEEVAAQVQDAIADIIRKHIRENWKDYYEGDDEDIESCKMSRELQKYDEPEFYTAKLEDEARMQLGVPTSAKPIIEAYLTDKKGTANKYHYFVLFEDRGQSAGWQFLGANVYGRIGVTKKAVEISRGYDKWAVSDAFRNKLRSKEKKGYNLEYENGL